MTHRAEEIAASAEGIDLLLDATADLTTQFMWGQHKLVEHDLRDLIASLRRRVDALSRQVENIESGMKKANERIDKAGRVCAELQIDMANIKDSKKGGE